MRSTTKNSRCRLSRQEEVDLLVAVVVLVLVGIILWLVIGPMINPCLGRPEGAVIQDPDHPDRVLVCKG